MAPLLFIPKFHTNPTFSTQKVSWGFAEPVAFQYPTPRRTSWKYQGTHSLQFLPKAFFGPGPDAPPPGTAVPRGEQIPPGWCPMVPQGWAGPQRGGQGIPAAPREQRARTGRERGGDSGGAALWRAPGRGWSQEPHFNEGRANANHCNRQRQQQQQKKGEAAAARAPQPSSAPQPQAGEA